MTFNPTSLVRNKIDDKTFTFDSMAKYLDMTKPTLYTRLAKHNWKRGEISLIMKLR